MVSCGSPLLFNSAFINADWVQAKSGNVFDVLNPATLEVITCVPDMDVVDVELAITAAHKAFESWSSTTAKERSVLLQKWHVLLEEHVDELARIMTLESGKPVKESLGEIAYGNSFVDWYAAEARRVYGQVVPSPVKTKEFVFIKQPIGVVSLITPVNGQSSSKTVDTRNASKGLLYPVGRIAYPRIVITIDGYQYYLTTFYNYPAVFKCRITIMNGIRIVYDELTGLIYVIIGSDSTMDLRLAQLYTDANRSNVIYNTASNSYEKIGFDGNGTMVLLPYTDTGKLTASKLTIRQYILTDDNSNQLLVTLDIKSNTLYRFPVYNDTQTLIPFTYSLLTGQGYLVYNDPWTCKIKLFKIERDLFGNFIAQNTDTGERRYVYYDEHGQLAFSGYPNYPPPKPALTAVLNLQTGSPRPTSNNVIY